MSDVRIEEENGLLALSLNKHLLDLTMSKSFEVAFKLGDA